MKDKTPSFDSEHDPAEKTAGKPATTAPSAEDKRAAEIAAIHEDRRQQAAVHTRFDATQFRRQEQG